MKRIKRPQLFITQRAVERSPKVKYTAQYWINKIKDDLAGKEDPLLVKKSAEQEIMDGLNSDAERLDFKRFLDTYPKEG